MLMDIKAEIQRVIADICQAPQPAGEVAPGGGGGILSISRM
jgi:hypothetical protein